MDKFTEDDRKVMEFGIQHNLGIRYKEASQNLLDDFDTARASEAMLREALMKTRGCECAPGNAPCLRCTALSGPSGEWLKRHDAEHTKDRKGLIRELTEANAHCLEVIKERRLARCSAQIAEQQRDEALARAEKAEAERDGLAALGLAWQPMESFRRERYQGEPILLLGLKRQRLLLTALPAEWSYWFSDHEDTYYMGNLFTHFMPMPCDPESPNWEKYTSIIASRDARIAAEARRKALMEVYERVKNLRGCNAYDVIDSIEEMAKETTNG